MEDFSRKREFHKSMPTVFSRNGFHFVLLPSGEEIPAITKTVITDESSDYPTVTVEFLCNLVSTKEEALKLYEEAEKRWNERLK